MYSTSPAAIVRIPEPGPTDNSIGDISGPVQDFESLPEIIALRPF